MILGYAADIAVSSDFRTCANQHPCRYANAEDRSVGVRHLGSRGCHCAQKLSFFPTEAEIVENGKQDYSPRATSVTNTGPKHLFRGMEAVELTTRQPFRTGNAASLSLSVIHVDSAMLPTRANKCARIYGCGKKSYSALERRPQNMSNYCSNSDAV